jgi:hypothetical protein
MSGGFSSGGSVDGGGGGGNGNNKAQSPKPVKPTKCGIDNVGLLGSGARIGGGLGATLGLIGRAGSALAGLPAELEDAATLSGFDAVIANAAAYSGVGEAALLGVGVGFGVGTGVGLGVVAAGIIVYDAVNLGSQPGCGP